MQSFFCIAIRPFLWYSIGEECPKEANGPIMKVILSPAKQMRRDNDAFLPLGQPVFLRQALRLWEYLQSMPLDQLRRLLACSPAIAEQSARLYRQGDPRCADTPALLAYNGIQYRYMAPQVFEQAHLDYVQRHVWILSGLYGALHPFDGVVPYRLEMQAKLRTDFCRDLYGYWGDALCRAILEEDGTLINLASQEYSRAVLPYLPRGAVCITCRFGEWTEGRVVEKGVYVKMARGDMVRFMAENAIERPEDLRGYDRMGYTFRADLSDGHTYVFIRPPRRPASDTF